MLNIWKILNNVWEGLINLSLLLGICVIASSLIIGGVYFLQYIIQEIVG